MSKINNLIDTRPYYVYWWENILDGTVYIGKGVDDRVVIHLRDRKYDCRGGNTLHFYRALNKYGPENFTYGIFQYAANEDEAYLMEDEWMEYLKSMGVRLYNIKTGGFHGHRPFKFSEEEQQAIIREYLEDDGSGRKKSALSIAKKWNCNPGTILKVLKRHNISARTVSEASMGKPGTNKGKKFSEEHKRKMGQSLRKLTQEQEDEICFLYNLGAESGWLAEKFGINVNTIKSIMTRNEHVLRPKGYNIGSDLITKRWNDQRKKP